MPNNRLMQSANSIYLLKYSKVHLCFCIVLLYTTVSVAQSARDFTKEERQEFHKQWTIDNWDDGGELTRYTFLNMSEFWTHTIINKKGEPSSFKVNELTKIGQFQTSSNYGELALEDYLKTAPVDAMLVLHNNTIVYETYPRMQPEDKHVYMSVTKIVVSTLIAILEDRGVIDVSKPIDFYLPELKGSGWQGVTILDILDMASGIDCLESVEGAYENPENCIYQYEATLGFLRSTDVTPKNTMEHIKSLQSQKPAGRSFEYTSVNTFVLSELIERVTNRSLAKNIEIEIWQKMGSENDALMAQRQNVPIAHAGMSSTLRDLARFGNLFLNVNTSNSIISNRYLNNIQHKGRPEIYAENWSAEERLRQDAPRHNTYQWDMVMHDGDFYKEGFGGQGLYVSPSRNLVIAFFGTPDSSGQTHELPKIARQLAKSGMFD
jgi:CubicO group peptidase (beta-lactamase class C family)